MRASLALLASLLFLAGCKTPPPPDPLTLADVIEMAKSEMTDYDMIREIDRSGTVFYLNADDVVYLRENRVSTRVIDYMLETRTRRAVQEERYRHYYDPYFYSGYGYYYFPRYHYRPPPPRVHFPDDLPSPRSPSK